MKRERLDRWVGWGLGGLVVGMPVYGALVLGGVRPTELTVLLGLAVGVVVLWGVRLALGPPGEVLWPGAAWGVVALAGYAALRYAFADLEYVARQEAVRVGLYAVVFVAGMNALHRGGMVRWVVWAFLGLGLVESGLAIYQFATHSSSLLWGFERPSDYVERGSGTYVCPNHLAGLLEMILPLGVAYTVGSRDRPLPRVVAGYVSVMIAAGLAVSMSRAGWVAAGVGLVVLVGLLMQSARQWLGLVVFVGLLGVAGGLIYASSLRLQLRAENMRRSLARVEVMERWGYMDTALRMWRAHLWFGVGPGHYDQRYTGYRTERWVVMGRPGRVHNDYLNVLADWGVVGAVGVGVPLVLLGWSLGRRWHRLRGLGGPSSEGGGGCYYAAAGAVAGLAAVGAHSLVDFNLQIPANALVAVVLLGLLGGQLGGVSRRCWVRLTWRGRGVAGVVLVVLAGVLGWAGWRMGREDVWVRRARAQPLLSEGRIEALKRAAALEPGHSETAQLIGEQYRLRSWQGQSGYREQGERALEWLERAARLNRFDPNSRMSLGACLDWLGRHEQAEAWFRQALERDPHGYRPRAMMGWHYIQIENYQAAFDWFMKSHVGGNRPEFYPYLDFIYQKLAEQKQQPAVPKK